MSKLTKENGLILSRLVVNGNMKESFVGTRISTDSYKTGYHRESEELRYDGRFTWNRIL